MFCTECGSQVSDGTKFCHQCGKAIGTSTAVTGASAGTAVQMSPESRPINSPSTPIQKTSWNSRTAFLLILLGVLGWLLYSVTHQNQPQIKRAFSIPAPVSTPVTEPVTVSLGEKAFTIPAGRYMYFKFTIPPRSSAIEMTGRFEATGGSGNDVEVVVLNEDEFTNWQNHHSVPTYYNSGKVTVGTLQSRLPSTSAGESTTYYLIFNNAFSVFSNKAVSTDITLHYDRTL